MTSHRWVVADGELPAWVPGRRLPLHERDWAWRTRLRSLPVVGHFYRGLVGLFGVAVVLLGLVMVPFPGPGWPVVFLGLLVLATEFPTAHRLLGWVRGRVVGFARWLRRQGPGVRGAVMVATCATAAAIVWGVIFLIGQPPGLPASWSALLTRWGGLPAEPIWAR